MQKPLFGLNNLVEVFNIKSEIVSYRLQIKRF